MRNYLLTSVIATFFFVFPIFSQDSTFVTVSYGGTEVDPVDSTIVYQSILLECHNVDTTDIVGFQVEVLDSTTMNLLSRNHIELPEDQSAKYVFENGNIVINLGYFLPSNTYKILFRERDYQGVLGEIIEITL